MSSNDSFELPLKPSGEKGIYNKLDWVKEADSKLTSARLLRGCASDKKKELEHLRILKKEQGMRPTSKEVFDILDVRDSANKSSILLLGYSIELLLKAGIVSLLIYAPKYLLEKKVRSYSHALCEIAIDLHVELTEEEDNLLQLLSSYIVRETRYPVTAKSVQDYCNQVNSIAALVSSDVQFSLGVDLYNKIRNLITEIDGTPDNMKIYCRLEMEADGFVTFRIGGPLPPVFIIKYCSTQIEHHIDNLDTIKELLKDKNISNKSIHSHLMEKSWDTAVFYRVSKKKGLSRHLNGTKTVV